MRYKNGFFQIVHKEDGTYLKFFPPVMGGMPIDVNDVMYYLHKIKLEDFDAKELNKKIKKILE